MEIMVKEKRKITSSLLLLWRASAMHLENAGAQSNEADTPFPNPTTLVVQKNWDRKAKSAAPMHACRKAYLHASCDVYVPLLGDWSWECKIHVRKANQTSAQEDPL